jgi:hypothetical protein
MVTDLGVRHLWNITACPNVSEACLMLLGYKRKEVQEVDDFW